MFALAGNLNTGLITNLMFDQNALNGTVASVLNIDSVSIRNSNVDHLYVTADTTSPYSDTQPTEWDSNTIMDANFDNGNANAGNVDFFNAQVSKILVQRQRLYKDNTNDWLTIFEYDPINGEIVNPTNPLNFSVKDYLTAYGETYRYRLLPVLSQGETELQVEGGISDPITAIFDGVFICSIDDSYRLYAQVEYDSMTVNQDIGVHTTLGNQYPIVVSNSATAYHSGGITGLVLPDDFGKITPQIQDIYNIICLNTCETIGAINRNTGSTVLERVPLNRENMVIQRQQLETFLTDKAPKVIKDWNGNMWLVIFTDNPQISFDNNWGMGLSTVQAGWTEIGDVNNQQDLQYAGMIGGNI